MAYLAKKGNRYCICESYQAPKLDDKGLPVKDENDKVVCKNKIKWTSSSKNKKLAEIELEYNASYFCKPFGNERRISESYTGIARTR
jgi:hypothetical protein